MLRILQKISTKQVSFSLKSPINIDLLKSDDGINRIRTSLKARFKDQQILNEVVQKYDIYRTSLFEYEKLSQQINAANRQMKNLYKKQQKAQIETLKKSIEETKKLQTQKESIIKINKKDIENRIMKIGNLVDEKTKVSKDQLQSQVVAYFSPKSSQIPIVSGTLQEQKVIIENHFKPSILFLQQKRKSYQQLNEIFGISDLKRGQKVSGHRGYFLTGNGVRLALALAQYGVQFLQQKNYKLYQTPAIIQSHILAQCGQLQTIDTDMYKLEQQQSHLIATSEQSLASYYRGETIEVKDLPIHMAGYSTCFRREAGAHGKDIHGLFRVHQFEKIQQFVLCENTKSSEEQERMLAASKQFYQSLKIPFRVVDMVSGDLNEATTRKFDLQGWYPSQNRFRELVSVSNCTDFQSRLLDVRYRESGTLKHPHMLNGTLVAIQRTITCLLENWYDSKNNIIELPDSLAKYMGKKYLSPSSL